MAKIHRFLAILGVVLIVLAATTTIAYTNLTLTQSTSTPRNIILIIGDGMSFSHIRLAQLAYGKLALEYFRDTGIAFTDSLTGEVPDSAATATALATGIRTKNGMIAMVPVDGKDVSVMTLVELAQKLGKSTGIITTTRVTHATPAAFASHVPSRRMEPEIAKQLVESGVDVIMGGGLRYFDEALLEKAREYGYNVVFNRTQLFEVKTGKILGLFSSSHIPYVLDRDEYEDVPSLVDMVAKAIDVLDDNPNGFFLMVEAGRIDHAAHSNDAASVAAETKELDDVVALVLNYALTHGDTLIVVTADHETGGMAVGGYGYGQTINFTLLLNVKASAEHMGKLILGGADPKEVIKEYTGIEITDEEAQAILDALKANKYAGYTEIGKTISKYIGVAFATSKHTGQPVPVFAYGPGSELFTGSYHQVEIARKIAKLMLFGLSEPTTEISIAFSPIPGDINGDKIVDAEDAYIVLTTFLGEKVDSTLERHIDMNNNGIIDLEDVYLIYTGNYGRALSPTLYPEALELIRR